MLHLLFNIHYNNIIIVTFGNLKVLDIRTNLIMEKVYFVEYFTTI